MVMLNFRWETFILGVVQGLCEFLPVSSSGHLALLQNRFGLGGEGLLAFDLLLHCATLLAVLIFFRRDLCVLASGWFRGCVRRSARGEEGWRYGWAVLAATAATGAAALPLKGAVESAMQSQIAVGSGLLVTAGLLFLVPLFPEGERKPYLGTALLVGLAQGLAVFPGVSRSGATIAAGLFLGLAVAEAFRFSFLISIPAILGASLLEAMKLRKSGGLSSLPEGWVWAALAAFVLGWLALIMLRRLVLSGRWVYFGLYCLILGIFVIVSSVGLGF